MKKISLSILFFYLLTFTSLYSQIPPNWTVSPSDYNHSMIITCVLDIDSSESRNSQDAIAAFEDSRLCGVASPSTYLPSQDRYVATLIVYSNNPDANITFTIYSNSNKTISNVPLAPIKFVPDGVIGTLENPYRFNDSSIPKKINFNNLVTPNNDGFNDFLIIDKLNLFHKYQLSIYDIRGQKVFATNNYQNNWPNSTKILTGEYYLVIEGNDRDQNKFVYKESFKLLKN